MYVLLFIYWFSYYFIYDTVLFYNSYDNNELIINTRGVTRETNKRGPSARQNTTEVCMYVHIYIYIYMYIYTYTYMYVCIYIYIYIYIHIYVYISISLYLYISISLCVLYIYIYIHLSLYIYIYTHNGLSRKTRSPNFIPCFGASHNPCKRQERTPSVPSSESRN